MTTMTRPDIIRTETTRGNDPPAQSARASDLFNVLERLQQALPLKQRQQALPAPFRTVHRIILRALAESGRAPRLEEVAAMLGSKQSALHALAVLRTNDLVVLSDSLSQNEKTKQFILPASVRIVGAYPMTTEKTPHRVSAGESAINAMCAVDALSISPMFGGERMIESKCHSTGMAVRIHQKESDLLRVSPSPEVRVGIRWQETSACAAHTLCKEMVFLKDEETARRWQSTDPGAIDIITLTEAVQLGKAFFLPLLHD